MNGVTFTDFEAKTQHQNMAVLIERLTEMANMTIVPKFYAFYHTLLVCNYCGKNKLQVQVLWYSTIKLAKMPQNMKSSDRSADVCQLFQATIWGNFCG